MAEFSNGVALVVGGSGGIGSAIIKKIKELYGETVEVVALGTNAIATAQMLKAGANRGASGENAIVHTVGTADLIVGVKSAPNHRHVTHATGHLVGGAARGGSCGEVSSVAHPAANSPPRGCSSSRNPCSSVARPPSTPNWPASAGTSPVANTTRSTCCLTISPVSAFSASTSSPLSACSSIFATLPLMSVSFSSASVAAKKSSSLPGARMSM